jgi:hypothetical protein
VSAFAAQSTASFQVKSYAAVAVLSRVWPGTRRYAWKKNRCVLPPTLK